MHKPVNVLERIERHAIEMREGECWLSTYKCKNQYGHVHVRGGDWTQNLLQHRVAWEAHNAAPIPEGMVVMHTCDNPGCFNPEHLTLGTMSDNSLDMTNKGRGNNNRCSQTGRYQ